MRQHLEDFRQSDRKKISLLDYEGGYLRRNQEVQNSVIHYMADLVQLPPTDPPIGGRAVVVDELFRPARDPGGPYMEASLD